MLETETNIGVAYAVYQGPISHSLCQQFPIPGKCLDKIHCINTGTVQHVPLDHFCIISTILPITHTVTSTTVTTQNTFLRRTTYGHPHFYPYTITGIILIVLIFIKYINSHMVRNVFLQNCYLSHFAISQNRYMFTECETSKYIWI